MNKVPRLTGTGLALCAALLLHACVSGSSPFGDRIVQAQPEQLTPVQNSPVRQSSLPPVNSLSVPGGADGDSVSPESDNAPESVDEPESSFVSLDDLGNTTNVAGRDLSSPLTVLKLLGVWHVQTGEETCRMNLTQSAKGSTGRYRASSPGCVEPVIASIGSWQLAGNQIQLFNEAGQLIGTLLQNGNRFVGTMVGGQGISMVG